MNRSVEKIYINILKQGNKASSNTSSWHNEVCVLIRYGSGWTKGFPIMLKPGRETQ